MSYLLDTCVLSELRRATPDKSLVEWLERVAESNLYLPAIVLGEIQQGISQLVKGKKRNTLQLWLDQDLCIRFSGRILDADLDTMLVWGTISEEAKKLGNPRPVVDCLIAATAIRHNLTLVTRNASDFEPLPVRQINPWAQTR